ncbi:winged helix-turn-helix transcriptional regulator [Catellatospora vulcania]|uniref:winged helix-turn-helix transcriptional regulator n=1 Tax=Catellatospora vulcania TaxID=1460450 RepID=UPI0012D3C605|nr:helix-turn-helix domain-containing protein [Catellatospora vulcania]
MSPLLATPVTAQDRLDCAATDVLRRVGDKWSLLVMALLAERPYGFNELDRTVPELSRRILALTLRELARDGLIDRTAPQAAGARAEYTLSELGRSLLPLVVAVGEWAHAHRHDIHRARARHDAGAPA